MIAKLSLVFLALICGVFANLSLAEAPSERFHRLQNLSESQQAEVMLQKRLQDVAGLKKRVKTSVEAEFAETLHSFSDFDISTECEEHLPTEIRSRLYSNCETGHFAIYFSAKTGNVDGLEFPVACGGYYQSERGYTALADRTVIGFPIQCYLEDGTAVDLLP